MTCKNRRRYDLICVWWHVKLCSINQSIWAWGCVFIVHSLTVSFFQCRPLRPTALSEPQPIRPTRQCHNRPLCYSDWCGAYGLLLSVIRPSILITVSGILIPEYNDLSQFNEDTGKPSVLVRVFDLTACPLA